MGRGRLIKPILWYVMVCENGGPKSAKDIHLWIPIQKIREVVDGHLVDASKLMFPDYILLGSRRGWRYIERALSVRLLRAGGKPSKLSEDELESIHILEANERNVEPVFKRGDHVAVRVNARSSYAGLEGRFLRTVWIKGGKLASVCLDLYGEDTRIVKVPADHLEVM